MSIFIFVGFKTIDRTPCNFSELMTNIAPFVAFTLILPINSGYLLFCELVVVCKKRLCECVLDICVTFDNNLDGSVGLILEYGFNSFFLRRGVLPLSSANTAGDTPVTDASIRTASSEARKRFRLYFFMLCLHIKIL